MKVPEEIENLTLEVVPEDEEASYEIIGNSNFEYGDNKVTIRVTASDGITKLDYNINVYRQPNLAEQVDLESLSVNKGTLTPEFTPKTLVYEVYLPYEEKELIVSASALDNTATVTGTGLYNLEVGLNIITVKVTSILGAEKTYQIRVTRAESDNANLASLSVQNHTISPNFEKNITNYNLETTLSELVIYAEPEQEEAIYEILGNSNLEIGLNEIIIRVTAPNGRTTKDYTLKVTKTASNNNNLAYLTVDGYDLNPDFNKSNLIYDVYVPNNINSVYIDAGTDDKNAKITGIGTANLISGENIFEIVVTSESQKSKTYIVNIHKEQSDNAYLKELEISSGVLDKEFDKLTNEYFMIVDYEIDNLSFIGYKEHENATVSGNGSYNLQVRRKYYYNYSNC